MTEQEYHDLLIRVDTRQGEMAKQVECIKVLLEKRQCQTHAEKIKTLERITWGAVLTSVLAIVKSFWSVVAGQ